MFVSGRGGPFVMVFMALSVAEVTVGAACAHGGAPPLGHAMY